MQRFYCYACQSAGSVNQWGFCEICGEEHGGSKLNDDRFMFLDSRDGPTHEVQPMGNNAPGLETESTAVSIRQDAA